MTSQVHPKIAKLKAENEKLKRMVLAAKKEAEETDIGKIQAENKYLRQTLLLVKTSIEEHRKLAQVEVKSKRKKVQ